MPPPTIARAARKPELWDAATTGSVLTHRNIGIFNILEEYTSHSVAHIGISTTTDLNEQIETSSVDGVLSSASINSYSPRYSPTYKKPRWRSPKRYREDSSCEEDKEQNIVNQNIDYDQSFESDSSLLELIEDMCFSSDSDASSSLSPSSSSRNALSDKNNNTPKKNTSMKTNCDKKVITEKRTKESSRDNRDTVKNVIISCDSVESIVQQPPNNDSSLSITYTSNPENITEKISHLSEKVRMNNKDKLRKSSRRYDPGDIRSHISRRDTISLQGKDTPSLDKRKRQNISPMVKGQVEENTACTRKQNPKSTKGEIKSDKMLCVMQQSKNSSVREKTKCSETVGKEKSKRKSKISKQCEDSEVQVKQKRDPEKVNSLKTEVKQQKRAKKVASKETNKTGQELTTSNGKENHHKSSREKLSAKEDQEKIESLVANKAKSTRKENPPKQSAKSGQELSEARSRSKTNISKCDERKNKSSKQKHGELNANQKQHKMVQQISDNSVKKGYSSEQSNENIKSLNSAVNATSPECVQTTDSEKVKKKLNRSGVKGNEREKLKDSDKRTNKDKPHSETSKIKEQVKKDLEKEQVKRDIAKEKDKQKKHGKMPAGELRHKKRKSLDGVKDWKRNKQLELKIPEINIITKRTANRK